MKHVGSLCLRQQYVIFALLFMVALFVFACEKENRNVQNRDVSIEKLETKIEQSNLPVDSLLILFSQFTKTQDDIALAVICKELGNRYRILSDFSKAMEYHQKGLNVAIHLKDTISITQALNNIGTDFRRIGAYPEASDYHYRALKMAEEFSNSDNYINRKNRVIALNGIGNIALSINNLQEAEKKFRQALENEIALKSNIGQAINYANIGAVFQQKEMPDSALIYYRKSMEQNKLADSKLGIGLCHIHFGEIYKNKNQLDKAEHEFRTAYEIMNKIDDSWHWLESCLAIARINLEKKQHREAYQYILQAKGVAAAINSPEHLSRIHYLLYEYHQEKNEYKKSLENYRQSQLYKDRVFNIKKTNQVNDLRMRFEREKNIRQLEQSRAEQARQKSEKKRILTSSIITFVLFSSLIVALAYAYRQRTKSNKVLKELEKVRTRFFTNISHEFRTPLTLIKAPIENILENNKCEKTREDLKIVLRNANQMLFLVEQLLNISKIDSGAFSIQVQLNDLARTIRFISNSFEYFAAKKSLDYLPHVAPSGNVWFDTNIVEIIIINLLSNAMKFTPEKGEVKLITEKEDDIYIISLENETSKALTDEELKHIFNRFYTTAQKSSMGTGIGLALLKEICHLYRAKIDLKYHNKRITFKIYLPVNKSHFSANEISDENINSSVFIKPIKEKMDENESVNKNASIVLIVEDNDDMRYFLQQTFQQQYQVITAKDGEEGIEKAKEIIPDVIISDVMMPNVSGLTLCETLKNDYLTNHIPIILLTALSEKENEQRGLNCKADDYVAKPFNSKILVTKVSNLLNHRDVLIEKFRKKMALNPFIEPVKVNDNNFTFCINNLSDEVSNPDFGVDEFCNVCSMSRTQLHRKLKALTGLSATAYIRFYRVKMAAEMLKNPSLSIADVCYASGFSDTSYFSKCFKEEFNLSPINYRKKLQN